HIEEPALVSNAPLVGPLVSAFREAWNSVAARWYVQLIMEQQQAFNRVVVKALEAQLRARDQTQTNASDLDMLLQVLLAWQEESRATLQALSDRTDALEARLKRLEGEEE
ncbi:MAG: hypothetical protein RRC07_11045, partial [Anaerolineae bacterium]|nr:hypothetical protein [Anaerolineae bacterium]